MGSGSAAARPLEHDDLSDVDVAARGICRVRHDREGVPCACSRAYPCVANDHHGRAALGAVAALRQAGRLPIAVSTRPCVERSETGACLACDAGQGEPCQHPSLKI